MLAHRRTAALGLVVAAAIAVAACSGEHERASAPVSTESKTPAPAPTLTAEQSPRFVPRCADGDRANQRHGSTCLCCHTDEFGVAGSVDPNGPPVTRIVVSDSRGDVATMAPNYFNNFFRHFAMTAPYRAVIYGPDGGSLEMKGDAPSSECNACHYVGGPVPLLHGP